MAVEKFVLFLAGSRSGHSFIGSAIDAHPNACVSHESHTLTKFAEANKKKEKHNRLEVRFSTPEKLFEDTFRLSQRFDTRGRQTPNRWGNSYDQAIDGQIKESSEEVRVFGNKNGGEDLRVYDFFSRLRDFQSFIEPAKLVFITVLRNPFDTKQPIDQLYKIQVRHDYMPYPNHVLYQEEFVRNTEKELRDLLHFLDLPAIPEYLSAVQSKTFEKPHRSRELINYSRRYINNLEGTCRDLPLFSRYSYSS